MSNNKTPVIGTGLKGLVGSRIVSDLSNEFHFLNFDISHPIEPIDITNFQQLDEAIGKSSAKCVVHCAAYTDVTKAWLQRNDKTGLAYLINVDGTKNVAKACSKHNKHLIHLSTAYVFDGEKEGLYVEEDITRPIEWYGETKWLAEQEVQTHAKSWTILRIDQPFRSDQHDKLDIVKRTIAKINDQSLFPQFNNHWFGPTFIDDFSQIIHWTLLHQPQGIFHASSGEQWTDFDFAKVILQSLKTNFQLKPGNLDDYLATTQRPYQRNTALDTSKLDKLFKRKKTPISQAIQLATQSAIS